MTRTRQYGITILLMVVAALVVPLLLLIPPGEASRPNPWEHVPAKKPHTSHASLMKGPFEDGPAVTRACLECHEDAAHQVMKTSHWTWETPATHVPGHADPVKLGKKNALNNFCIGVQPNLPRCTSCHAGYGWQDADYDFDDPAKVDCLVCHDRSGTYVKGLAGLPDPDVDLVEVARQVGMPNRENCGGCHFRGGGGNAVKHGDLDESLYYPSSRIDVHMGRHGLICTDCHKTEDHNIRGRAVSVSFDTAGANQVRCDDCHKEPTHRDTRLSAHIPSVACQACHIPIAAVKDATKVHWDWSAAGQDLPEDPHHYLKIKGRFEYQKNLVPEYTWFNGKADHYLFGETIPDTDSTVYVTRPEGSIGDPDAVIWPFKVHRGRQIYDTVYKWLITPKTYGEGGYWTEFDWDQAARLGSDMMGQPYSGSYGFVDTAMYWPISHMVSPAEHALQCVDCHGDSPRTRMDWYALGYPGDPIYHGGRSPEDER